MVCCLTWLSSRIEIGRGTEMMEVDIHAIKAELEAHPQVVSASVERVFPSALKVTVREHIPVFRIAVLGADDQPRVRIVSRAGTVYEGVGYAESMLESLPFVQPYQHPDGSYQPMRGIDRVADLLAVAREKQPRFYRTWKVVSLEHYSGDEMMPGEVIEVKGAIVERIIFGASADFGQQMDRLKVVLDYVRARGNPR